MVPGHEGHCSAFHGHRYVAEISCQADGLDHCGRIVDFGVIKERVGGWIAQCWDHTAILMHNDPDPAVPHIASSNEKNGKPVYWLDAPPTGENIVQELARQAEELLSDTGVTVCRIRLWETPNCSVEWALGQEENA